MDESKKSNSRINLLCGVVALICFAMMFVPIGELRGDFNSGWHIVGTMQYAWGEAVSGFNSQEPIYMIVALLLTVSAILLAIWAIYSFRGNGKLGLGVSIFHLLVTAFTTIFLIEGFNGNVTIPVVVANCALAIVALVLAILQKKANQ